MNIMYPILNFDTCNDFCFSQIEMLTEQLDHLREKYRSKHDDCKRLEQQINSMERFVLVHFLQKFNFQRNWKEIEKKREFKIEK